MRLGVKHRPDSVILWVGALALALVPQLLSAQTAGDLCTASVLNQAAFVQEDGYWEIRNVPANLGPVRARVTCATDAGTVSGASEYFTIVPNEMNPIEKVVLGAGPPTPVTIAVSAPVQELSSVGEAVQLAVVATLPDGSTVDVTAANVGTIYSTTSSSVATVGPDGLVTAVGSGRVLVTALHDAIVDTLALTVLVGADSDGDGLPDDWEVANGLDPNDPADALEDQDRDGLTAGEEFGLGTDPRNRDTDGDGLEDGEEIEVYGTDPLLFDTDGDGVSDGLEVLAGSDPLDAESVNLGPILDDLEVDPESLTLTVNTAIGEASRRLRVTGHLQDGSTLDITSSRYGTTYDSSDLTVANFGGEDGRVFAGQDGLATITVGNSGLADTSEVAVATFAPTVLSSLVLPGFANDVDVEGDYAYVACGQAGLQVVDVSDLSAPFIAGDVSLAGNANDVRVVGDLAFVAAGDEGLVVVDVTDPTAPVEFGSVATAGAATDLVAVGTRVYVADELGLRVIDVSDPTVPAVVGGVATPGRARGVDVAGDLAVVADTRSGIHVVDLADEAQPQLVGSTHTGVNDRSRAAAVAVRDSLAYVADGAGSLGGLRIVDFREPSTPVVIGSTDNGFALTSVALDGQFALASDYFFVNAVPVFGVGDPVRPEFRALVDFSELGDEQGNGLDVRDGVVFLAASDTVADNGSFGRGLLYIGRYLLLDDSDDVAPVVTVTAPADGGSVLERRTVLLKADASDDIGVGFVEFLVDGLAVGADFQTPFEVAYAVPEGATEIRIGARAQDLAGNQSFASQVHVDVAPDDSPTVEILAPVEGSSFTEGVTIDVAARATDDIAVTAVDFYVDGALVESVATPPYRTEVQVPVDVSEFTLRAEAADEVAQVAVHEVVVGVVPDDPPSVVVLDPGDGDVVVPGPLDVLVGASDDFGVEVVRLLVNSQPRLERSEDPYDFQIQVPAGAAEVRLRAEAEDGRGQTSLSEEVVVQVASDPGTTVVGTVVDPGGAAASGATVVCQAVSGLAAGDGSFQIGGVAALAGAIRCAVSYRDPAGDDFVGLSSPVEPVAGGVTDVGQIAVVAARGFLYPGPKLPMGDALRAVEVADLDGDGRPDLVGASDVSDGIAVVLARPDGGYDGEVRFDAGDGPRDVTLVDLDLDGALDAVTANRTSDDLSILAGFGDGTFAAAVPYAVGDGPVVVESGFFDSDGIPDLVTALALADAVSVDLGDEAGGLVFSQLLTVGDTPEDVTVADVDADGDPDIVSADHFSSQLSIFLGQGDGSFVFDRTVGVTRPVAVAVADLNGDFLGDLIVARDSDDSLAVSLAQGDGSYGGFQIMPVGAEPTAVAVGDVDGDGVPDVAVSNEFTNDVSVFLGVGDGTFLPEIIVYSGSRPLDVEMADLNLDGIQDLVTANFGADDVSLLYGLGTGAFDTDLRFAMGEGPDALVATDFNGDGDLDLAGTSYDSDEVVVLLGSGDGTFAAEQRFSVGDGPFSLASADFDGDDVADLVAANDRSDDVSILLGAGDGTFGAHTRFPVGSCPESVAVADIDADSAVDLVIANACSDDVSVLLGNGAGSFGAEVRYGVGSFPLSVAVGHLDSDGNLDLVAANSSFEQGVSVLLGNGDGTFGAEQRFPAGSFPSAAQIADFDGDADNDLAVVDDFDSVSVLLGNGDGSFQAPLRLAAPGYFPSNLAVGDLNGDGAQDIATTSQGLDEVALHLGNGDGTFEAPQFYATGVCPEGILVADFDADGRPDLGVAAYCSAAASVLLHR